MPPWQTMTLTRSLRTELLGRPCKWRRLASSELEPSRAPPPIPRPPPFGAQPKPAASPKREKEIPDWKPNEFNPVVDVEELLSYPLVNRHALSRYRDPPRRIRTLVRDFIDDSLYNPYYGYFSTQAEILDFGTSETEGFAFNELKNDVAFDNEIAKTYGSLSTAVAIPGKGQDAARQIWHTPTELFKPWYARAVARYLVAEYKATLQETGDSLLIYEVGAGNGTMMRGILDYLAEEEPEAYERTTYHVIEISERLARTQKERAERGRHAHKVEIANVSIFDWRKPVLEPCFFLAFEVLDNFAHDVVRYTTDTVQPMQCFIAADETGDLKDYYEPTQDPLILRYLTLFQHTLSGQKKPHVPFWRQRSPFMRSLATSIPLTGNLGPPIFIPTKALLLLDVLRDYFPQHLFLASDFHYLPDAVKGVDGPVVQTRYKGMTVPCTTYLVTPGYFDIFFPTNFQLLSEMHSLVMSPTPFSTTMPLNSLYFDRVDLNRPLQVASHRDFLSAWAEKGKTRLKNGSDPMLEYYHNASWASSFSRKLA